ncbi:MAG TPA: tRNA lysidine(34) synthetase TilS [Caldimonas sp.]|nr:tRNA lysidine(34) synthetase TilS [Caldimonas sp.]
MMVDLSCPGRHEVPAWHGSFLVDRVEAGGLSVAKASRLELRARAPGDSFQAGEGRPRRSLKLQFQAKGVAPTLRDGPILCSYGVTAFVPGLGLDARARAAAGEVQVALAWLPD